MEVEKKTNGNIYFADFISFMARVFALTESLSSKTKETQKIYINWQSIHEDIWSFQYGRGKVDVAPNLHKYMSLFVGRCCSRRRIKNLYQRHTRNYASLFITCKLLDVLRSWHGSGLLSFFRAFFSS